ncbi:hypothetical protein ACJX0J_005945 [Zea mays]
MEVLKTKFLQGLVHSWDPPIEMRYLLNYRRYFWISLHAEVAIFQRLITLFMNLFSGTERNVMIWFMLAVYLACLLARCAVLFLIDQVIFSTERRYELSLHLKSTYGRLRGLNHPTAHINLIAESIFKYFYFTHGYREENKLIYYSIPLILEYQDNHDIALACELFETMMIIPETVFGFFGRIHLSSILTTCCLCLQYIIIILSNKPKEYTF